MLSNCYSGICSWKFNCCLTTQCNLCFSILYPATAALIVSLSYLITEKSSLFSFPCFRLQFLKPGLKSFTSLILSLKNLIITSGPFPALSGFHKPIQNSCALHNASASRGAQHCHVDTSHVQTSVLPKPICQIPSASGRHNPLQHCLEEGWKTSATVHVVEQEKFYSKHLTHGDYMWNKAMVILLSAINFGDFKDVAGNSTHTVASPWDNRLCSAMLPSTTWLLA